MTVYLIYRTNHEDVDNFTGWAYSTWQGAKKAEDKLNALYDEWYYSRPLSVSEE